MSYSLVDPSHRASPTGEGGEFILAVYDAGFPLPGVNGDDLQATLASRTQHYRNQGLAIDYASLVQIDSTPGLVIRAVSATGMSEEADAALPSGGFITLAGGFDLASVSRTDQQQAFVDIVDSMKLSGVGISKCA